MVFGPLRRIKFLIMAPFIVLMLFIINVMTSPGEWWVQWAAFGIGIAWVINLFKLIRDVVLLGVLCVLVLLAVLATWRGLAFTGFDPEGASVQDLPVRWLSWGFWLVVALAIAICTRVLGALPVFAFSVLPPLAAGISFVL